MSGNSNKIIAFNYFGGKFTWLEELYQNFPDHFTHLIDLFAGSMSVPLNYKGKVIKTACEINEDITNFFYVLREHESELTKLLLLTPYSKSEFNSCWNHSDNKIEQARRFYVRIRQSFFGLGAQRKNKGWHMAKKHVNAKGGETVSRWNNAIEKLHEVAEIIRSDFQIINDDYRKCIDRLDFPNAFFYCDPPYLKETRASFNDYKYEFSEQDHIELAEKLQKIKGMAMVSGYNSDLYNELYKDWHKIEFPSKFNNIRSSEVREVIWMNYSKKDNKKYSNLNFKMKPIEEYFSENQYYEGDFNYYTITDAIVQAQNDAYNKALEDAAKNARTIPNWDNATIIDKQSILELKRSP